MRFFFRPWILAAMLVLVCAMAIGGGYYYRNHQSSTPAELVGYLPDNRAGTVLYIDVKSLRTSGLLDLIAGSKIAEESEYKSFVQQTHLDYSSDLDAVAAVFRGDRTYFVLRGRFDWAALRGYALQHHGACNNSFCRMVGSKPERHISFYPLRSNVMALAVSTDEWAANSIKRNAYSWTLPVPNQPLWMDVPAQVLKTTQSLPSGTKAFASAMENAEDVLLSAGPSGDKVLVNLAVTCASAEAASTLVVQLENTTNTLRKWLVREKQQPNSADLSGVLVSGNFRREDRRVFGQWPIEKSFIQNAARGVE